jgi:hypothetical protein
MRHVWEEVGLPKRESELESASSLSSSMFSISGSSLVFSEGLPEGIPVPILVSGFCDMIKERREEKEEYGAHL